MTRLKKLLKIILSNLYLNSLLYTFYLKKIIIKLKKIKLKSHSIKIKREKEHFQLLVLQLILFNKLNSALKSLKITGMLSLLLFSQNFFERKEKKKQILFYYYLIFLLLF
jgi:hypothetical protein